MISTRWSTGNHRELADRPRRSLAPQPTAPPPGLLERPAVMLGIAVGVGIAIGMLVKWGFRR